MMIVNRITNNYQNNYNHTNFKSTSSIAGALKNTKVNEAFAKTIVKATQDGYSYLGAVQKRAKGTKEENCLNALCDRIFELRFRSNNGRKKVFKLYFKNIPEPIQTAISVMKKSV